MEKKKTFCLLFVVFLIDCGTHMYASEGALRGKFAISATDTVAFSRGNLQYQPSTQTWRFAENQWDYVGNGEAGTVYEDGVKSDNSQFYTYTYAYGYKYKGWMDLFGWGTGNNPTRGTTSNSDYSTWSEWGYNAIVNGGNRRNLWRTLNKAEWEYVLWGRENAESLIAVGTVNGVNGTILLPDDWAKPADLTFKPYNSTDSMMPRNNYTADEWILMEMAGAVFLPITMERNMTPWYTSYCHTIFTVQEGVYWTRSNGYHMITYYNGNINRSGGMANNYVGKGVRLVQNHDGSELFPVMPDANSALFRWTSIPNAETYTLHIYEDSARTQEIFYITFDRNGTVTGLHFVPHAPARRADEIDTIQPYVTCNFFYTIANLTPGTDYWYTLVAEDAAGTFLAIDEQSFQTKQAVPAAPTGLNIQYNEESSSAKFLKNGSLYIRRGETEYTVQGRQIK